MRKVEDVRVRRAERFQLNRSSSKEDGRRHADKRELEQQVHLVRAAIPTSGENLDNLKSLDKLKVAVAPTQDGRQVSYA